MSFLTDSLFRGTDWRALERAIARLMSHCGWSSVQVVGQAGDCGGDVVGIRTEAGKQSIFIVQVKSVIGGNYVGPSAIQEAVTALGAYHGDVPVVATNGDFTSSAKARAKELLGAGYSVRLWNGKFLRDLLSHHPENHWEVRSLRPYQQEIGESCLKRYSQGVTRAQFVVATGLGKTVIAAEIVRQLQIKGLKRILVLCHSQDLAQQLEQAFWPQIGKSIPSRVFFDGEPPKPHEGVDFGLYQTFSKYINGIDPDAYDIVVVDEAHHAITHGFRRCINHLRPKLLIGMTATPWRGDGENLDALFGTPIAQVSLVDGMLMGYLAQVDYRIFCDTVNWKTVAASTGGALTVKDLNKRLFLPQRDEAIVDEIKRAIHGQASPRLIVFCPSIEHCERFANLLSTSAGLVTRRLSGLERVERHAALMEFAAGKVQAVTAVDVLNEGIDVPSVSTLVFLRSTHSRRIFVQQLGRGLRLAPGKERLLVLDFVTDIRRITAVMQMNEEAKNPSRDLKRQTIFLKDGFVTFNNTGEMPFVQRWIQDVAELGDSEDTRLLKFPELT